MTDQVNCLIHFFNGCKLIFSSKGQKLMMDFVKARLSEANNDYIALG